MHEQRARVRGLLLAAPALERRVDARVQQLLEPAPLGGVGEHARAQRRARDLAVVAEHAGAEVLDHGRAHLRLEVERVHDRIR